MQGFKVCRYLFVRCDNEPAPWTRSLIVSFLLCYNAIPFYLAFNHVLIHLVIYIGSDEHGDRPRALPPIKELKGATDMTERKGAPAWDYDVRN